MIRFSLCERFSWAFHFCPFALRMMSAGDHELNTFVLDITCVDHLSIVAAGRVHTGRMSWLVALVRYQRSTPKRLSKKRISSPARRT